MRVPTIRLSPLLALPALLCAAPAVPQSSEAVQEGRQPYVRAVAAGYRAAMVCGAIFNGGRSEASALRWELVGIYPEYDSLVRDLRTTVDRRAGVVDVHWDARMPPRRAVWRRGSGCSLAPIGAGTPNPPALATPPLAPLPPDPRPWPLGDTGIAPAASPALDEVVTRAFDEGYGRSTRTAGVVILRDGRVIAERYADGFNAFTANRTWSVAKSIAGTIVGMAGTDPRQRANIPEWRRAAGDPRAAITIDNLLRMASGLHSDTEGSRTDAIYFGGTTVTEQATSWPLETRPGTRFRYANNDIMLAIRSVRATVGEARYRGLPDTLFSTLGMRHTVAQRDWQGNYILSSDVWTTARDLARLGQFWLQDGVWQGRRLLPAGWVRYMTSQTGPQPERAERYGASIWLFGPAQGLPTGSYSAQGNRGQFVAVIPSQRLVIVRRGEDPSGTRFDIAKFAAAVIESAR